MIMSLDLDEVTVGDHLVITLEVEKIVRTPEGTRVTFKQRIIPMVVDYKGNPTFEASTNPITVT